MTTYNRRIVVRTENETLAEGAVLRVDAEGAIVEDTLADFALAGAVEAADLDGGATAATIATKVNDILAILRTTRIVAEPEA